MNNCRRFIKDETCGKAKEGRDLLLRLKKTSTIVAKYWSSTVEARNVQVLLRTKLVEYH